MACCQAAVYGWCRDLPLVDYRDESGKEYCVFHAPQQKKGISVEQFNQHIFFRIEDAIKRQGECNLSGTVFEGDIHFRQFSEDHPFPEINFSKAIFSGWTDFSSTKFGAFTSFAYSEFKKYGVDFTYTFFSDGAKGVDFSWAQFHGDAYFKRVRFLGRITSFNTSKFSKNAFFSESVFNLVDFVGASFQAVDFDEAIFNKSADFSYAHFMAEANFSKATFQRVLFNERTVFDKKADFSDVAFKQIADFSQATFNYTADFKNSNFNAEANFGQITFNSIVDFTSASYNEGANFSGATLNGQGRFLAAFFKKEANFVRTVFRDETDFRGAMFGEGVNFEEAIFAKTGYFFGNSFPSGGDFRCIKLNEQVNFQEVHLKKLLFADTDVRKIDFLNCYWPEKKGRRVFYDEIELFSGEKDNSFESKIKKIEILYRRLKQKYKEEHNDPEVSNWHYGEKEMARKRKPSTRYNPIGLSNIYWLSSGYGERPVRAGIFFILLILTASILFGLVGFAPSDDQGSGGVKLQHLTDFIDNFGMLLLNTLQHVTFDKAPSFEPTSLTGKFFKIAAQILIPIQAALLALAVRNRFRR